MCVYMGGFFKGRMPNNDIGLLMSPQLQHEQCCFDRRTALPELVWAVEMHAIMTGVHLEACRSLNSRSRLNTTLFCSTIVYGLKQ